MADDVEFMVYDGGWWDVYDLGTSYKIVNQEHKERCHSYPKDDNPDSWINKTNRVYINKDTPPAKDIKIEPISTTSGFKYLNDSGLEEKVLLPSPCDKECVEVVNSLGQIVYIYTNDIPKLIAALKAAYEYETGEVI